VIVRGVDQPLRVAADEHLLAELSDPDGRAVVLPERIWEEKIIKDHPGLRAHLEHVLGTVTKPDHAEPDPRARRRRYYRRRVGPSRWLLVVVFDHADYDSESDVLYLHVGAPQDAEGEETPEGHVLRFEPGTQRIVGLNVINARWLLDRDGHLTVTMPETVQASADDLAPALAAA
jgi:hypothetical protein